MKVIFAGTPDFAAVHLDALVASKHDVLAVITQPDKPGKRGRNFIPSAVKARALEDRLPVLQPNRLRLADLENLEADVMIVVAYGQILKPEVLAHPRLGCINVHGSLLPRWRGAAPVQRAILAGDKESGITLIQMDAGLDTGDMLSRIAVSIDDRETSASLFSKFEKVGPPLLIELLNKLEQGIVEGQAQDDSLSTYANKIDKREARIDWQQPALQVDRQVRAFNPDPIAFTFLGDHRIKIHGGHARTDVEGPSGEVLELSKAGVLVGCHEGAYLIESIQLPIGKGTVLNGQQVLNGFNDVIVVGHAFR